MKTYPKVPRHDHDSIPDDFYSAEDLIGLEKTDGQNLRIFLYDDRFEESYSDDLDEFEPRDGDVFLGTKKAIRGKLSDDPEKFKGNFNRLISYLRNNLKVDVLREYHTKYDTPLVLFGEHMIRHSLNYEYKESPPPAVLGFDVFLLSESTEILVDESVKSKIDKIPSRHIRSGLISLSKWTGFGSYRSYVEPEIGNPYNEDFEGFVSFEEASKIFEDIGLEVIEKVDGIDPPVNPDEVVIPNSHYAEIQAEGVVFRSDALKRRTKKVTPEFKERMKTAWGIREDQAESGEELVSSWYLTNGRIRKYIHKQLQTQESLETAHIAEAVVYDIWIEEWEEISEIDISLNPQQVYDFAVERVEEILDKMETNAHLNDSDMLDLWEAHSDIEPSTTGSFDINKEELERIEQSLSNYESVEKGLIEELLETDIILNLAQDIVNENDKEFGRWVIEDLKDEVREFFWTDNLDVLANIDESYTPTKINEIIIDLTVEVVNTVVSNEEELEEKQINTDAIGEFFK